jgi:hypothetical protein
MKRKLAWVCLLVSPLVIGGAAFSLLPRDPITQGNCEKIKEGMTLSEVVGILGKENLVSIDRNQFGPTQFSWEGSRGSINIAFQTPVLCAHGPRQVEEILARMVEVDDHYFHRWGKTLVFRAVFSPSEAQTIFGKIRNWLNL